ncbi:MAG: EAL domain-containing protein [Gallionella sp.]
MIKHPALNGLISSFVCAVSINLLASGVAHAFPADNLSSAAAQNPPARVQVQEDTLVVGSEQDYPPFATGMTDATAGGFTVDLWKAVAKETGLKYTIRVRPFYKILQEFREGKIDVLINLAKSPERDRFADFSVPHVIVHGAIFVRDGETNIRSEDDLAGKSIIVVKADIADEYAVSKGWGKQLVRVDTAADGLRLLASGKHDAMLLGRLVGMQTLSQLKLSNIEPLKLNAEFAQKFCFAVHKGQSDLLARLNEGLALVKASGTYDELYKQWFGVYEVKEISLRDWIKYIIPFVLILLSVTGYFYYQRRVERRQAEANLRIAATAFESQEGMMITDAQGVILRVNHAFINDTGYTAEEAVGQTPRILKSGRHDVEFYRRMWESINQTGTWQGEIWDRRKNGEVYPKWLTITAVKRDDGVVTHYVGTHVDITERKSAEKEIQLLAYYDPLTRLPNRRLLMDRLQQAMASGARTGRKGALLLIDLDNFKTLNDTLGHQVGDQLLQQIAQRLEACVRGDDTVARLGGDEFIVLLEGLSEQPIEAAAQTEAIGEKILAAIGQPYQFNKYDHQSTCSIGAVLFNDSHQAANELLKHADIAMYQAKKAGRNTLRFFDPKMQASITARVSLEKELRNAIEKQQFQLHYQIQVDNSNRTLGAETLIRWLHPERGFIPPVQFIPLAEETNLILPIGKWVLEAACAQLKRWEHDTHTCDLTLSVNVSARQFRLSDFVSQVQEIVQSHAINPKLLKLELTESMLVENTQEIISTMNALNDIGVQFSLDDFGTGYSSLQYLKKLPLTQLKIDQSFVHDISTNTSDKAIVRTIIAMARSLDMDVIAEGVETQEQRQFLLGSGCYQYQGYLFGKPVPIEKFETLLRQA